MNDLSSAACVGAFAWLTTRRAEIGAGNGKPPHNAEWTCIRTDGKPTGYHNGACHGGMSTPARSAELIANVSHWASFRSPSYTSYAREGLRGLLPQADGERFYDWLVNRSFASPYILAPSLDFATNVGFAIRTDIPANLALAICTLSRNCSESAHVVKRWLHLLDLGASEDLAYVLAFGVNPTDKRWGTLIHGHNIVTTDSLAYIEAFVRHEPKKLNGPLNAGGETYGVTTMWGSPRTSGSLLADLTRFTSKASTSEIVIENPFKRVVTTTATVSDAFLESIIPNLTEYLHDARQSSRQAA